MITGVDSSTTARCLTFLPSRKKKKESFECAALSCLPLQRSEEEDSSGWRGFLSSMGLSIPATLCRLAPPALRLNRRRMLQGKAPDIPEHVLRLAGVGPDRLRAEWSFPAFIAMFLPEFPHKAVPGHEHFQVNLTSTTKLTDLEKGFIIFPQSHDIFFLFFIFLCFNTFFCLGYLFQKLPGVELHRQRFLWTHTESERQGQAKDLCCQSQSSVTKHNPLFIVAAAF